MPKEIKKPSRQKMIRQTKTGASKIYVCKTLIPSFGLNIPDLTVVLYKQVSVAEILEIITGLKEIYILSRK